MFSNDYECQIRVEFVDRTANASDKEDAFQEDVG